MKKTIKKIVLKILQPVITRLGYVKQGQRNQARKSYLLENFINILKENNYQPKLIIDVGANHGTWSRIWKKAFPQCKFILIEPQHWLKPSFEDLLDKNAIYLPIGAGKQNGSFTFTINSERDDSSTFLLTPEEAFKKGFKQIEIPVKTLNTVVEENGNIIPEIVKIDAEGLDIEVMEGSSNLFGRTEVFLVEASINSPFSQTELITVINYMDNKGYRAFELTDINRPFSNKVLWLVEIAFVKRGGYIDGIKWI
jgi:FkbM family methyltransferase